MEFNLWSFILDNFEAAGAIGGYVSISIIGFALISFIAQKRFDKISTQIGPKWLHPIIGSFFGAIPGCGATIILASLYKKKKISFGGLFASFISTLGEGSFVLLGSSDEADVVGNLEAYLIVTIFGFITGIIFGYLADFFGIRKTRENNNISLESHVITKNKNSFSSNFIENLGVCSILVMAIFLAPGSIMALWGQSIESIANLTYWISIILTITCIVFYLLSKYIYKDLKCYDNNIISTLSHAVLDVSMVVTYVFIALFIANYVIDFLVGAEMFNSWMTSSLFIVVLLAALIGLTPGCGGMIAVATAFITIPNFPISALIAAAIATSGDGIFPLIAENRKDGLIVTIIGLLIAVAVGYFALFLEIKYPQVFDLFRFIV